VRGCLHDGFDGVVQRFVTHSVILIGGGR